MKGQVTFRRIALTELDPNEGQIKGLAANPREWTSREVDRLARSMKQTPALAEARGCIVVEHRGRFVILGGNLRRAAAERLGWTDIVCAVLPPDTPVSTMREVVIKDNSNFGEWDLDALRDEWSDIDLSEWGVRVAWDTPAPEETDAAQIERMQKDFEERMARGEITEEDEEYQEFLEKFKLKKTTDDCYTPAPVYDAVARYVAETYGLDPKNFVRPFYPGGNYQKEKYPKDCVVVDNPPFSILAEILKFYRDRGVRFFLFAPTLTLFSSSSTTCTALPTSVAVVYENGASVNTSFLTNLEPGGIRLRSAPKLYRMVEEGVEEFLSQTRRQLPKYHYPPHIILAPWVGALSRLGVEFSVPVAESEGISALESQKPAGKAIFGKGYIVSDRVAAEREKAEREKAEREKAEREKAERWPLSDKEYEIIARLNRG